MVSCYRTINKLKLPNDKLNVILLFMEPAVALSSGSHSVHIFECDKNLWTMCKPEHSSAFLFKQDERSQVKPPNKHIRGYIQIIFNKFINAAHFRSNIVKLSIRYTTKNTCITCSKRYASTRLHVHDRYSESGCTSMKELLAGIFLSACLAFALDTIFVMLT